MLARISRKRNPRALLVGTESGTTTSEMSVISVGFFICKSQKLETNHMSINSGKDKRSVVYLPNSTTQQLK